MKIGILGGTGVYDIEGIENLGEERVATPFGDPSDAYVHGRVDDRDVYFLPRHGRGHRIMPSEINHRANIFGFKLLGVDRVIAITAVGSLREQYRPRDIVLIDQYFDRTKASSSHTFFGNGLVAHVPFGYPTSAKLRAVVKVAAAAVLDGEGASSDVKVHEGGTYVNMEGPAFSTLAESNFHRQCGFDVIGMTSLAEAKLCREAEIAYQPMCMITDYDCWHEEEAHVSVETVIGHLRANAELGRRIVRECVGAMPEELGCESSNVLATSILTPLDQADPAAIERLRPLIGRYL